MSSYGQLTAEAVEQLTSNPELTSALSAPAQVTAFGLYEAMSEEAGSLAKALPAELADDAAAGAMMVLKFVMTAAATGDIGAAAKELAQTAISFIPFFGMVINAMWDGLSLGNNAHLGLGPASGDKSQRAAWCQNEFFVPPVGSGPDLQVMPCDIFGPYESGAGSTSLGMALICMTEPDSIEIQNSAGNVVGHMDIVNVRKIATSLEQISPGDANPWKWAFNPKLGVPKDLQKLFKKLRMAIGAMKGRHETDGGVALMITYTDLLRITWEAGYLGGNPLKPLDSSYYFNALMDAHADVIHSEVKTKGETCYTHDKRAGQGALGLIQGWKQTLHPYAQFSKPEEIAAAQEDLLDRVQGMLDRNNRVELLAAALQGKLRKDLGNFGDVKPRRRLGGATFSQG